jgi:hypothetical protein
MNIKELILLKLSTFILFNHKKIPLFSKKPIPKELIEQSIVIGMNRIEDETIRQRMRQCNAVHVEIRKELIYIDIYDALGKCCRLQVFPSVIGHVVKHIKEE